MKMELSANELRIGNYIDSDGMHRAITFQSLEALYYNRGIYKPIPLTEEWLVKFGFELNSKFEWRNQDCFSLLIDDIDKAVSFNDDYSIVDIKHVHSLQNLYFALTGIELTIK